MKKKVIVEGETRNIIVETEEKPIVVEDIGTRVISVKGEEKPIVIEDAGTHAITVTSEEKHITIDEDGIRVVAVAPGPQGEQGETGPQGETGLPGADGADGADGAPGPNEVTTSTDTNIAGLLKGEAGKVAAAIEGTDYAGAGVVSTHESTHDHTQLHTRAHDMDSADDHNAAAEADRGKYARANAATGEVEWAEIEAAVVDTFDNIFTLSPDAPLTAFATDRNRKMFWDGSQWWMAAFEDGAAGIDMGSETDHNDYGLGRDYLTRKRIHNSVIGWNDREEDGAASVDNSEFRVWLDGALRTFNSNFRIVERDGQVMLQQQPLGYETWLSCWTGDSEELGLNGVPMIREGWADMGAYPSRLIISGGEF